MPRSFGLVDDKLAESAFFFERLEATQSMFEARCFLSAFASSCRSVTFAMQACLVGVEGFDEWYAERRIALRDDPRARYFQEIRRLSEHVGLNPLVGGMSGRTTDGQPSFRFLLNDPAHPLGSPEMPAPAGRDVVLEARAHLMTMLTLVRASYERFGHVIDPHVYYTQENFERLGLTIADAEEEIIGMRGWTDFPDAPLEERWRLLRRHVAPSGIGELFAKYLSEPDSGTAPASTP